MSRGRTGLREATPTAEIDLLWAVAQRHLIYAGGQATVSIVRKAVDCYPSASAGCLRVKSNILLFVYLRQKKLEFLKCIGEWRQWSTCTVIDSRCRTGWNVSARDGNLWMMILDLVNVTSSSRCHIFVPLKNILTSLHFYSDSEVIDNVRNWFQFKPNDF